MPRCGCNCGAAPEGRLKARATAGQSACPPACLPGLPSLCPLCCAHLSAPGMPELATVALPAPLLLRPQLLQRLPALVLRVWHPQAPPLLQGRQQRARQRAALRRQQVPAPRMAPVSLPLAAAGLLKLREQQQALLEGQRAEPAERAGPPAGRRCRPSR